MEKKTIKIILANDHDLLRKGIKVALQTCAPHIQIVGEVAGFEEIFRILPQLHADILMTDDIMPEGNISTAIPLIRTQYPELKIIINSIIDDRSYFFDKMKLAEGWLNFVAEKEDYVKAVETVNNGGFFFYVRRFARD